MTTTLPPPLIVDELKFSAKIDYVTFNKWGLKIGLPPLTGNPIWTKPKYSRNWMLTIHDPTAADLRIIVKEFENPDVTAFEIALDMEPKASPDLASRVRFLETLFTAVAGRFRPEDKALCDYGIRAGVSGRGQKLQNLERRFPRTNETVIYGHRGEYMQAKLYLKVIDQGKDLPPSSHRVRMEVSIRDWGCRQFGLFKASDLFSYPYRKKFATNFRIIDRPEVKLLHGMTEADFNKRTKQMHRAWRTAGVGKFTAEAKPREDTFPTVVARIKARAKAQLPSSQFKMMRDQEANAKIGAALTGLERRMKVP